jgi:hypothetical protein
MDAGDIDVDVSEAPPPAAPPPAASPMVRPNQPAPTVMFESSVHGSLANLEKLDAEAAPPASSEPAEEPEPPAEPSPRPTPTRGKAKPKPLPRKGIKSRPGFASSKRNDESDEPAPPKPASSKAGLIIFLVLVLCGAAVIGVILLKGKGKPETSGQEEPAPAVKPRPVVEPVAPPPSEEPAALAPKPAAFVPPTPPPAEKPVAKPAPEKPAPAEKPSRPERPAHAEKPVAEKASAPAEAPKPAGGKLSEDDFRRANEAYQRGNTKLLSGNTAEAIAEFNQALKLNPKDPAGHRGLGLAHAQANNTAEAVKQLKLYLKAAPKANDRAMIEKKIDQLKGK